MEGIGAAIYKSYPMPELSLRELFEKGIVTYNPEKHMIQIGVAPGSHQCSQMRSGLYVESKEECALSFIRDTCQILNHRRNYKACFSDTMVASEWQAVTDSKTHS